MHTLLIMRHAKAEWAHPGIDDYHRLLTPQGFQELSSMSVLLPRMATVDGVLASPAERTTQTAETMAVALGVKQVQYEAKLYNASEDSLWLILQTLPEVWTSTMIIGHNPGLSSLATGLKGAPLPDLETANLYGFHLKSKSWAETAPGMGECFLQLRPAIE